MAMPKVKRWNTLWWNVTKARLTSTCSSTAHHHGLWWRYSGSHQKMPHSERRHSCSHGDRCSPCDPGKITIHSYHRLQTQNAMQELFFSFSLHTHTHTHTHTHAWHTHTCILMQAHTYTHTCMHIHTNSLTHTDQAANGAEHHISIWSIGGQPLEVWWQENLTALQLVTWVTGLWFQGQLGSIFLLSTGKQDSQRKCI